MHKDVFVRNRSNLMRDIEDNSVVILLAGSAPYKGSDEKYQFTPNRNFYYFTGIDEEQHVIVMEKIKGQLKDTLFIKEIDEEVERWVGRSIRPDEASDVSGIDDIKFISELEEYLRKILIKSESINFYIDISNVNYVKEIREKYPSAVIKNIIPRIIPLRKVKCNEEIENIQKAINITIEGIKNILNNIKPGMKEYETEAYFEFACKSRGAKDYAFKTIAAAGKNATILHYVDNDSTINDGDLVLFDLGAQYKYYNGDITRTFPANGKFTDRQKDVYNSVLRINRRVIDNIKPGVKYKELNQLSKKWIADECIKLGLISNENEVSKYYWHSIGHSLGLETHDIDSPDRDTVFKEGMVWTVEPGIYIEEEGIGVRIEDDILVTADGAKVLTAGIAKSVEDIEEFMKRRG